MVFARRPVSPLYVPVDEAHPFVGSDPYALSKQVDEATAATMQRRHGYQVVALRISNTSPMPDQIERAALAARDPGEFASQLWAYLDARDAARAFALAVERDLPGCHVINVMAPDTISPEPTADLLARFHPTSVVRRALPAARSRMTARWRATCSASKRSTCSRRSADGSIQPGGSTLNGPRTIDPRPRQGGTNMFTRIIRLVVIGWIASMIVGAVAALQAKRRIGPTTDESADEIIASAIFAPIDYHSTATAFRGGTLDCGTAAASSTCATP